MIRSLITYLADRQKHPGRCVMISTKILIIDDSPIARRILKSCLPKSMKMEIFEAGDGLSGLQQFEKIHPDITFIDLTMPVMSGMEALEKIRNIRHDAVVIVASADIQPKTQERVRALGAFGVLRKPPSPQSVADMLLEIKNSVGK